ncbi:hypothetical protein HYU17_01305 [Candidatus Woesearchaeota archaeon]|nr:hypothetical protein [Candidatus Woesearchaeota archaeon]
MLIPQSLEEAVAVWEQHRDAQFPMFSDIKVETTPKRKPGGKGQKPQVPWEFSTNNRRIRAYIHDPAEIEKRFREAVVPLYAKGAYGQDMSKLQKDPQRLEEFLKMIAFHNNLSLLGHELLHPAACPSGDDEKKIDLALYGGIMEAMPQLQAKDCLMKIDNVRNLVWDHIIDLFQYHFISSDTPYRRNLESVLSANGHGVNGSVMARLPEGVIPIFNIVSCTSSPGQPQLQTPSPLQALTNVFYALLFCGDTETRKGLYGSFMEDIKQLRTAYSPAFTEQAANAVVRKAMLGFISELDSSELGAKGISRPGFEAAVDGMFKNIDKPQYSASHGKVVEWLAAVLGDKETRYKAVKGFIKPLAPFISVQNNEGRHKYEESEDETGAGGAGSALENLLEQLPKGEADQLLQDLADSKPGTEKEAKLVLQAMDDYYKRNSKEVMLKSPKPQATTLNLGKKKEWQLERSETATEQELRDNYNVDALMGFAASTGLPVLQRLDGNNWQVNHFREKELPLTTYTFQSTGIEMPRNIVFLIDTSGSQQQGGTPSGMGESYVGTGNKYDALMHEVYGILKTMAKASSEQNAPINVFNINYSSSTIAKGPASIHDFLAQPASQEKAALLVPQNGTTSLDAVVLQGVERKLAPGKTAWLVFCDGDLEEPTAPVFEQFRKIAARKDSSIVYFQIYSGQSGEAFANFMRNLAKAQSNVTYNHITSMDQVTKGAMSVLVKYAK